MVAAILAGGLATRLRDVVEDRPKCLVEIQGKPFLQHQIEYLHRFGVTRVVMLVGHLSDQIEAFLGNGARYGLDVCYVYESSPLGTAGAVKNAESLLPESFLVFNGDTLVDLDLGALIKAHEARPDAIGTIALCEMDDVSDYGSVQVSPDGHVTAFLEKQPHRRPGLVNAGVYCFRSRALAYIPANTNVSTETEFLPKLLAHGERLTAFVFKGVFVDIGTPDRLNLAQTHFLFGG